MPACGHRPGAPYPPLPSPEQIIAATAAKERKLAVRPVLKPRPASTPEAGASRSHPLKRPHDQPPSGSADAVALSSSSASGTGWTGSSGSPYTAGMSIKLAQSTLGSPAKRVRIREPQAARIRAVLEEHDAGPAAAAAAAGSQNPEDVDSKMPGSSRSGIPRSMGPLMDRLPPDMLSSIMSLLAHEDLASLGATCHAFRKSVKDGSVWRDLLHREFPNTELTASSAADWQYTYTLQVSPLPSLPRHMPLLDV